MNINCHGNLHKVMGVENTVTIILADDNLIIYKFEYTLFLRSMLRNKDNIHFLSGIT